jgi:hypothetical protein
VLTLRELQLAEAVHHGQGEGVFASVTSCSVADGLGVIVHGFYRAVVDLEIKIGEDSLLMTSQHPGKIPERFNPAVGCPPEPAFEVFGRPSLALVVPELSEELLEQIRLDRGEVHRDELCQGEFLLVREIPGVFQPDVAGSLEHRRGSLGFSLHPSDLVNGLQQVADNMELVEDDHLLPTALLDDIDIVLPHVAAHPLDGSCALFSPPLKEPPQGILIPVGASPYKPLLLEIVDLSVVDMTFLAADLINADESDTSVVFPLSAVSNRSVHRTPDRVPGDVEKSGNLVPGKQSRPKGKHGDKGKADGLLSHAPGDLLHSNPMLETPDPSRPVREEDRNAPQADMTPASPPDPILDQRTSPANAAGELSALLRIQLDPEFIALQFGGDNTMILDPQGQTYDTGHEHGSFLRYLGLAGDFLNSGFDSCLLPFRAHP